jgi:hypothetical protein
MSNRDTRKNTDIEALKAEIEVIGGCGSFVTAVAAAEKGSKVTTGLPAKPKEAFLGASFPHLTNILD